MTTEDTPTEGETQCSFCLKPRSAVKTLISAPSGHHICDECVVRYSKEMGNEPPGKPG